MLRKLFAWVISLVMIVALLSSTTIVALAQGWTSSTTTGWTNTNWSYVVYGYNDSGQYYAKRYENGNLIQDIRARGTNLWNETCQILISAYALNRSSTDLAIDVNGNVYGVDASTNEPLRFDSGYYYPVRLSGYQVQAGTPFLLDTDGFIIGIYTTSGLIDLSGESMYEVNNNYGFNNNGSPPPTVGDGPGSIKSPNDWNLPGNNFNGGFYHSYPYVYPTNLDASEKTYYLSNSVYYTYTLSNGKLTFTKNGGSSKSTVYSSGVVEFAFTDNEYVDIVYMSDSYYFGIEVPVGSTSSKSTVFSKAISYSFNVDMNGFTTSFVAMVTYPYFTPTTKSSSTRTYYSTSNSYYTYKLSSGSLSFTKNGGTSKTVIESKNVVYFSFTSSGYVVYVYYDGSYYYGYRVAVGKNSSITTIFSRSTSWNVTTDDKGFVTAITSSNGTFKI